MSSSMRLLGQPLTRRVYRTRDQGRGAEHAKALLADYRGILQCDGYSAYKTLAAAGDGIALAFCWSHAHQLAADDSLRFPCGPALAASAHAPQPEGLRPMAADEADCRALNTIRQNPTSLAATTLPRQIPEVGAECVSSARSDLSGGRGVTRVPTGMGDGGGCVHIARRLDPGRHGVAPLRWHDPALQHQRA
jgi:hypothetical protein